MEFLPLGQGNLHLGLALLDIELQRHQGHPLLLHPGVEPVDFIAMHQELPRPTGLVVEAVPLLVGADMGIDQVQLAAPDLAIAVAQVGLPRPQRFDLCPGKSDARLVGIFNVIVVPCLSVFGDDLYELFFSAAGQPRHPPVPDLQPG